MGIYLIVSGKPLTNLTALFLYLKCIYVLCSHENHTVMQLSYIVKV